MQAKFVSVIRQANTPTFAKVHDCLRRCENRLGKSAQLLPGCNLATVCLLAVPLEYAFGQWQAERMRAGMVKVWHCSCCTGEKQRN